MGLIDPVRPAGTPAGADPVGRLADAPPAERRFVSALRLWLVSPDHRSAAEAALSAGLDPGRASRAALAFDGYLAAIGRGASRKIWRHNPGCPCLGRDEALLAAAMREAAAGRRDAAWSMLAATIRPAALFETVESAGALGRALAPAALH